LQNPVPFLESEELEEWDMILEDDGSRKAKYFPYSANGGFFFVRNNPLTRFFFSTFLRMGETIFSYNDQSIMNKLISEFASSKGLRAKVIPWGPSNPFPCGKEFQSPSAWDIFRQMFNHGIYPYTLHMSWTHNMTDKIKYFQQLGLWYLGNETSTCSGLDCCLEDANYLCHYQDKPSMYPCPHAPKANVDYGVLFWE
jgi:hypothetical protein